MSYTPTKVKLDSDAHKSIRAGIAAIYEPVRRTLGPEGKNALIYRTFNRGPRITNDGKTIAGVIEPKNEMEKLAADAFKEAANRTDEKAGDGTTTTIVVGGKLGEKSFDIIDQGASIIRSKATPGGMGVMKLKKLILSEADKVKKLIRAAATPIKDINDLIKVATVSVEDPDLGKRVAEVAWAVGTEGFVDVVEGYKGEIETEIIKGMRFPAKVAAKIFINNPARYEMVVEDCPVLVTNHAIDNIATFANTTNKLKTSKLIVFAPSFSENVLLSLLPAKKQGFIVYPVACPALRTEQWEDLAIYTGSKFINKDANMKLENIHDGSEDNTDLGHLEKLVVKDTDLKEDAIAISGINDNPDVVARVEVIKKQMGEQKTEILKKMFERRLASMSAAVGIIRVGGPSQAESLYTKLKAEDAAYACKSAMRGGTVKGAGLCLKEIADTLPNDNILKEALLAPYNQIMENADGMLEIGEDIIDPADSVYYAVEHATSVVAHLITVSILIPEMQEPTAAEGNDSIAKAIGQFTAIYGKQVGILNASQFETMMEQDQRNDEAIFADK